MFLLCNLHIILFLVVSTPVQSLTVSDRTTSSVSFTWSAPTGVTPDSYMVSITKEGEQTPIEETTTTLRNYQRYVYSDYSLNNIVERNLAIFMIYVGH